MVENVIELDSSVGVREQDYVLSLQKLYTGGDQVQWLVLQGDQLSQSAWDGEGQDTGSAGFELGKSGLEYPDNLDLNSSSTTYQLCDSVLYL